MRQKGKEVSQKAIHFLRLERTKQAGYRLAILAASVLTVWGGWKAALIAIGKVPGATPSFLPATLPLLVSGTLSIDRFAAVFCVILAAVLLLTFAKGTKGSLKSGIVTGIAVVGVLTAATPFTLVAWLVLVAMGEERNAPQKTRLRFLLGMGAIALSVLLFSGGAFLADMTLVATIAAQLPSGLVSLALVLLFGGSLWIVRDLKGAYLLVPAYVTLRFCLFFLGPVSAALLTLIAVIASVAALCMAKTAAHHALSRTSLYLLLAGVPLTMIAVQMQVITAVQCFLFGGIFVAVSGILGDARVLWAKEWERAGNVLTRFFFNGIPGTFMGSGMMLMLAGFWALGENAAGAFERAYLLILAVLFIKTLLILARLVMRKNSESAEGIQFSGPLQMVIIAAASMGFAQLLTLLETTIGGETRDWTIDLSFATKTLSVMPVVCLAGGIIVVALAYLLKTKNAEVWAKISTPIVRAYAWADTYTWPNRVWESAAKSLHEKYRQGKEWLEKTDARMAHAPLKETALVILACFVVTLIVLF